MVEPLLLLLKVRPSIAEYFYTFYPLFFILAWMNLSNDVFDAETGIDKNKAHSLVNLTGNKPLILVGESVFRFGFARVLDRLVATRPVIGLILCPVHWATAIRGLLFAWATRV